MTKSRLVSMSGANLRKIPGTLLQLESTGFNLTLSMVQIFDKSSVLEAALQVKSASDIKTAGPFSMLKLHP